MVRVIDSLWVEHLTELDDMRRGIGLRGYAQQDPLNEFKSVQVTRVIHDAFALSMADTLAAFSGVGVLGVLAALMIRSADFVSGRPVMSENAVRREPVSPPAAGLNQRAAG